jgi:hypothetical protein
MVDTNVNVKLSLCLDKYQATKSCSSAHSWPEHCIQISDQFPTLVASAPSKYSWFSLDGKRLDAVNERSLLSLREIAFRFMGRPARSWLSCRPPFGELIRQENLPQAEKEYGLRLQAESKGSGTSMWTFNEKSIHLKDAVTANLMDILLCWRNCGISVYTAVTYNCILYI